MPIPTDPAQLQSRLRSHVNLLAAVIGPRHLGKPSTIDATTAYITQQFTGLGDTVTRQTYPVNNTTASNLIIERPGSTHPDQIVIVGAHYDTVPPTPGADDNASAVAMLIEVARLSKPLASRRTLRFVSFACEEPPHFYTDTMGSQHYAHSCRQSQEKIVGMLCLEMVGFFSDQPNSQQIPPAIPRPHHFLFPKRANFLTSVANFKSTKLLYSFHKGFKRATNLRLFSIALPERINEIRLSDNSSFWDQNYPALMITDTSFLRNPHYHQPTDLPETLDYHRLTQATLGVAGAVSRIAK
jgi:hypothetical protein